MSKVVVYILDRLVWMLLITALTTQALQIAGILESPNTLPEISYSEGSEYHFDSAMSESEPRFKRETAERSKLIDGFFNNDIGEREIFLVRKIARTKVIRAKM